MKQLAFGAALVGIVTVIGAVSSNTTDGRANAQPAPPSAQSGDALWHLPRFGEQGWFLHANNGRVRACNLDKVSVIGERAAPRCSKWTVDLAFAQPMYPSVEIQSRAISFTISLRNVEYS